MPPRERHRRDWFFPFSTFTRNNDHADSSQALKRGHAPFPTCELALLDPSHGMAETTPVIARNAPTNSARYNYLPGTSAIFCAYSSNNPR
jgi:hypothetical protein